MPDTAHRSARPATTRNIDTPVSIRRCLVDLWREQKNLLFSFDNDPGGKIYEARIQKLDLQAGRIVLNMLLPPDTGEKPTFTGSISVRTGSDQGKLLFTTLLDISDESDLPGQCVLLFPTRLIKEQFRNAYRVSLVQHENRVVVMDSQGREFSGTCLDLSVSGLLFRINRDIDIPCEIGQEFSYCHVNLAGLMDFTCRAAVRRCEQAGTTALLLGLSFDELTEQHARELSRLLAMLERNCLRQRLTPGDASHLTA